MSQIDLILDDLPSRPRALKPAPDETPAHGEIVILNPDDFYRQHYQRLYSVARRILRDRELSRDAVQEAFKNIFLHLPEFRGDSRLETWMTRIVVNVCFGYLRKQKSRRQGEVDGVEETAAQVVPDHHADPLEVTYRHELRDVIRTAMGFLKKIHREVIYLHDVKQHTLEEISEQLGIPVGTIKSRLFYGRRELRSSLACVSTRQACQPV